MIAKLPWDCLLAVQMYLNGYSVCDDIYKIDDQEQNLGHFFEGYRRFLDASPEWCEKLEMERNNLRGKSVRNSVGLPQCVTPSLAQSFYSLCKSYYGTRFTNRRRISFCAEEEGVGTDEFNSKEEVSVLTGENLLSEIHRAYVAASSKTDGGLHEAEKILSSLLPEQMRRRFNMMNSNNISFSQLMLAESLTRRSDIDIDEPPLASKYKALLVNDDGKRGVYVNIDFLKCIYGSRYFSTVNVLGRSKESVRIYFRFAPYMQMQEENDVNYCENTTSLSSSTGNIDNSPTTTKQYQADVHVVVFYAHNHAKSVCKTDITCFMDSPEAPGSGITQVVEGISTMEPSICLKDKLISSTSTSSTPRTSTMSASPEKSPSTTTSDINNDNLEDDIRSSELCMSSGIPVIDISNIVARVKQRANAERLSDINPDKHILGVAPDLEIDFPADEHAEKMAKHSQVTVEHMRSAAWHKEKDLFKLQLVKLELAMQKAGCFFLKGIDLSQKSMDSFREEATKLFAFCDLDSTTSNKSESSVNKGAFSSTSCENKNASSSSPYGYKPFGTRSRNCANSTRPKNAPNDLKRTIFYDPTHADSSVISDENGDSLLPEILTSCRAQIDLQRRTYSVVARILFSLIGRVMKIEVIEEYVHRFLQTNRDNWGGLLAQYGSLKDVVDQLLSDDVSCPPLSAEKKKILEKVRTSITEEVERARKNGVEPSFTAADERVYRDLISLADENALIACLPHTDFGLMTFICPDDKHGLVLQTANGECVEVDTALKKAKLESHNPNEACVLVVLGGALQHIYNGVGQKWVYAPHLYVTVGGVLTRRLSNITFCNGNDYMPIGHFRSAATKRWRDSSSLVASLGTGVKLTTGEARAVKKLKNIDDSSSSSLLTSCDEDSSTHASSLAETPSGTTESGTKSSSSDEAHSNTNNTGNYNKSESMSSKSDSESDKLLDWDIKLDWDVNNMEILGSSFEHYARSEGAVAELYLDEYLAKRIGVSPEEQKRIHNEGLRRCRDGVAPSFANLWSWSSDPLVQARLRQDMRVNREGIPVLSAMTRVKIDHTANTEDDIGPVSF